MHSVDFIKLPLLIIAVKGLSVETNINGAKAYYIVANLLLPLNLMNTMLNGYGQYIVMMGIIDEGEGLSVYGRHLYPLFYITSLMAKVFTLFIKRKQLNKLLLDLDESMPRTKDDRTAYQLEKYYNQATSLTRAVAIIAVFAINYASFSPTAVAYIDSRKNGEHFEMQYPYESYPIYPTQKIFFPVFFFSQCWEAAINIGTISAINFMIYGIIYIIHMHYKHLAKTITAYDATSTNDHNDYKHLIWCVMKHNQLNEFINQLNDIFSIAVFFNISCSISILVLYCFMGINVETVNDLIQYLMNAFSSIVELYVMCYFSQKIRDSSSAIPQSLYESLWYTKSVRFQKSMIMTIRMNRTLLQLRAYKFANLSMESFLRVMQLSYRLLALLNNVEH